MNINDRVKVTLTREGRRVLAKRVAADQDDYSEREWCGEFQLWRLIQAFGPDMYQGAAQFFEENRMEPLP